MQSRFLICTLILGLLLGVLLFSLGPAQVTDRDAEVTPAAGQKLPENHRFASERNFFRYTLPKSQLSREEITKGIVLRFGVSVDAIFNANDQRGAPLLKSDSQNKIRIPLTQKLNL